VEARLRQALARAEEVARELADPETARNPAKLRQLGREHARLDQIRQTLERRLADLLTPADPLDDRDAIVEIRAGTGGDEAALFAAELFRMYTRFCERRGWKVEVVSLSEGNLGGLKEAIFAARGPHAYGTLRYESGVHRVQRVPLTEAQGRIHTSAATVAVLPEAEEVDVRIDEKDLRIDVFRSQGQDPQLHRPLQAPPRPPHPLLRPQPLRRAGGEPQRRDQRPAPSG